MPKATVPFGELRPDLALLDNQFANVADNVFPYSNTYRPIPSLVPFSTAMLPSPCMGLFSARKKDGTWRIYAGTATRLYEWSYAGWTDITNNTTLTGGNYHVTGGERWAFCEFGTTIIATQLGDISQSVDSEAAIGTRFTDLAGTPPVAHGCKVIGDFVFLYGLASDRYAVQWSAINDCTGWTIGTNLSDIQHFPDLGPLQGVAGSEVVGYIVQDRGIRSLQFLPGDINFIFTFAKIVKERGSISEFGYETNADILYFLSEDGFYGLAGTQLIPIGFEKVNDYFLANSDIGRRNIVQCFVTAKPYVIWPFHSNPGAQFYDRMMIYNWANQRWATGSVGAEIWANVSTEPLDLDTDDATDPNDPDLDSNSPDLDSFKYLGGRPVICAVNQQGQLCSLAGPNLAATLQTAEAHLIPGMRAFVSEVYPLADSSAGTVLVETRERLGDDRAAIATLFPIEVTGFASVLSSARLHRFTLNLPLGDTWTQAQGVLVDADPDGYA